MRLITLLLLLIPVALSAATDTARYRVTFVSDWSATTHPTDWPSTAHYSPLIGLTHRSGAHIWKTGTKASTGIKNMAERGMNFPLVVEIADIISAGNGQHQLNGAPLNISPGSVSLEFDISLDYPLVSLVCMIAPSPDWFVGIDGQSLLKPNGQWHEVITFDLHPYDAGTDSGTTYTSPNEATTPTENIRRITGQPFLQSPGTQLPLGKYIFTRLDTPQVTINQPLATGSHPWINTLNFSTTNWQLGSEGKIAQVFLNGSLYDTVETTNPMQLPALTNGTHTVIIKLGCCNGTLIGTETTQTFTVDQQRIIQLNTITPGFLWMSEDNLPAQTPTSNAQSFRLSTPTVDPIFHLTPNGGT